MLAVPIEAPPQSADDLAQVFNEPARSLFRLKNNTPAVVSGGTWPSVERIAIDLSGAAVIRESRPPVPADLTRETELVFSQKLDVFARPLLVEGAPVNIGLIADNAHFDLARDPAGKLWMALRTADNGQIEAVAEVSDLESLLKTAADAAAQPKGASVEKVDVTLQTRDGATQFSAVVTAKKSFVKGSVRLGGKLTVDSELNARISDLSCDGEGMIGGVLAGFIRPLLSKFEGETFALTGLPLGGIKLRDVRVETPPDLLRIRAAFGEVTT